MYSTALKHALNSIKTKGGFTGGTIFQNFLSAGGFYSILITKMSSFIN